MKRILLFVFLLALFVGLACDDQDFNLKRPPSPTPMKYSLDIDTGNWDTADVTITVAK